jgi:hypothetical protein
LIEGDYDIRWLGAQTRHLVATRGNGREVKTGTLTRNELPVTAIHPESNFEEVRVLAIAAQPVPTAGSIQ